MLRRYTSNLKNLISKHQIIAVSIFASSYILIMILASIYGDVLLYDYGKQIAGPGNFVISPVDSLIKYDSAHFINIAKNGYSSDNLAAFFPLYPLLIRMMANTLNIGHGLAALVASWISFILAATLLYRWILFELEKHKLKKVRCVVCFNVNGYIPYRLLFNACIYGESIPGSKYWIYLCL